jgi:hypothetical protein
MMAAGLHNFKLGLIIRFVFFAVANNRDTPNCPHLLDSHPHLFTSTHLLRPLEVLRPGARATQQTRASRAMGY